MYVEQTNVNIPQNIYKMLVENKGCKIMIYEPLISSEWLTSF